MSVLVCAHPWELIMAEQYSFRAEGDEKIPAVLRCPICHKCKNVGDPDPKVVIAKLEEEQK